MVLQVNDVCFKVIEKLGSGERFKALLAPELNYVMGVLFYRIHT